MSDPNRDRLPKLIQCMGQVQMFKLTEPKNLLKPPWGQLTKKGAIKKLRAEVDELEAALENGNRRCISEEAADVGNFATFCAANWGDIGDNPNSWPARIKDERG